MKKDVIAIVHSIIQPGISIPEVEQFLEEHFAGKQWDIFPFHPTTIQKGESSIDWKVMKMQQENMFKEFKDKYLTGEHNPIIVYFGYSPIPLVIHLGFLFTSYTTVVLVDKHRSRNRLEILQEGEASQPDFWTLDAPPKPEVSGTAKEDAIFRVQTSKFEVQLEDCDKAVPTYHKQAWLYGMDTLQDPFTTRGDIQHIGELFARGLEKLKEASHYLEYIHLFASVQPPVAFLMGQKIYESHPPVICYNYAGGRYEEAFLVNRDDYTCPELSVKELEETAKLRSQFADHFEQHLKPFLRSKLGQDKWYQKALGTTEELFEAYPALDRLNGLTEDELTKAQVLVDCLQFDGNAVLIRGRFQFPDLLLHSLITHLSTHEDRLSALRMLVFHEWLHQRQHNLRDKSAKGIGKFPKILEELDYQADVYALLNEVGYLLSLPEHSEAKNDRVKKAELVKQRMDIAVETYWAFHALEPDSRMIEVRQVHRHLIWAVQWLECDRLPDLDTVQIIRRVLAHRPLLEMEGFEVRANKEQRMVVNLKANLGKPVRMAMYLPDKNRLSPPLGDEAFKELVPALLERSTKRIRDVVDTFLQMR